MPLLSGFRDFVYNLWTKVKSTFQHIWQHLRPRRIERHGKQGVSWSWPQTLTEAQLDKGILVNRQLQALGLRKKPLSEPEEKAITQSIPKIGTALGLLFETGVTLYLLKNKGLRTAGGLEAPDIQKVHQRQMNRLLESFADTGVSREKFLQLLYFYVRTVGEEIYRKSQEILGCDNVQYLEYIGMTWNFGQNTNLAGADLILYCEDSGEGKYWSMKYGSNAHSSVAQKSPAFVHRLFGGLGRRTDEYYFRLTSRYQRPDQRIAVVLGDLWDSLRTGHAFLKASKNKKQIFIKPAYVASIVNAIFRGDTMTSPAFVNYTVGQSAVGEFSPALQRDFPVNKSGKFKSSADAVATAEIQGDSIKITYRQPGSPANRATYFKFYVDDITTRQDQWRKYGVQIQANNLTTL